MPELEENPPVPAASKSDLVGLFRSEEGALLRFAYGLTGRRAVAEEIVQEGFLRLHRHWDKVEQPRPWIYRCVRNLAINERRSWVREGDVKVATEPMSPDEDAPERLQRMETLGLLRMCLAELTMDEQRLLRMKFHEELSYKEMAERLGISVGNVGYRLHHLLKSLAVSLRGLDIMESTGVETSPLNPREERRK